MRAEFFLTRMEAQRGGNGWRILLCDNTGGGVVRLRPITFPCVGVDLNWTALHIHKCWTIY
jgi:hypothetical protein